MGDGTHCRRVDGTHIEENLIPMIYQEEQDIQEKQPENAENTQKYENQTSRSSKIIL